MKSRGLTTWFAVDCLVHVSPKVMLFAGLLGVDVDTAVGKLTRLWAWAKMAQNESGVLGPLPDAELAGIMRWKKKPEILVDALIHSELMETTDEGALRIHGWYEANGKSAEKARKERERKRGTSRDTETNTKTKTAFSYRRRREAEAPRDDSWMNDYD
ncbi:MAG: hypothetical protein IKN81_07470 [Oscillospiraceae bacterium]|nr:hypothetical protein [Oscillospiraceae bacterium]